MKRILIVYHSQEKGNTRKMAELVAAGCRQVKGVEVELVNTNDTRVSLDAAEAADAYALGSPDYYSYMAGGLKMFFDDLCLASLGQAHRHAQTLRRLRHPWRRRQCHRQHRKPGPLAEARAGRPQRPLPGRTVRRDDRAEHRSGPFARGIRRQPERLAAHRTSSGYNHFRFMRASAVRNCRLTLAPTALRPEATASRCYGSIVRCLRKGRSPAERAPEVAARWHVAAAIAAVVVHQPLATSH